MNHKHHPLLVVVFIKLYSCHSENSRTHKLRIFPLPIISHPLLSVHPCAVACPFELLFQLCLHISDLLGIIKFFPIHLLVIGIVLLLVPLLLIGLLGLLPAPCCVLIIEVDIPDVSHLGEGFSELGL